MTTGVTQAQGVTATPGGGGAATPSGPASGDLSGTYPAPTVVQSTGLNLYQDTAGSAIGQRSSTTSQQLSVYGTYTDANNYERVTLRYTAGNFLIGAEYLGTGAARGLGFEVSGSILWLVTTSGGFNPTLDGVFNIGASNVRVGSLFTAGPDSKGSQIVTTATTLTSASKYLTIQNSATALTQTLPTSPIQDERRDFFNHGAGTMNIAGTFLGGLTSPRALSQGAGLTVQWNATLAGWSCH